ncbi:hypothetical protein FRC96_16620 [Lujinxingia vulgaris]|uniref:RCC1-like domain-containing protein n=1 Tax=Lujinxingia vulgaris TaxID=2600176 RepID=A0A5C6X609_9DELT|nr:hypothetical protein [Lujinxingia vulgaris]TXD32709.1 hypothetical protein FRC96_16620 [Lujinxingia vulgaris]
MKSLTLLTRHALAIGLLTALVACSEGPDTRTIPPTNDRPDVEEDAGDVGPDAEDDAGDVGPDAEDDAGDVGPDAEDPDAGDTDVDAPDACEGESDEQLCQLSSYSCGSHVIEDSCGELRTVESCGPECGDPETCGGGGIEGQCGCTPALSDEQHCAENAAECGELTIVDSCGEERVIDCGAEDQVCTLFDTCGGGGEENICGCTPITCEEAQVLCGPIDDGCGGTVQCDEFCVDAMAVGDEHACAVGSGKLKCWGRNNSGQIGNGANGDQRNPVDVSGLPTMVDVAPGGEHTCALSLNGEVFCWGENERGQLGLGTTVGSDVPGGRAINSGATAIASGFAHSCAVVNGGVRCWGANDFGQIGSASIAVGNNINVGVAMQVQGLSSGVVDVVAGSHHSCALLDDGTVRCWGRNRFGQVGTLSESSLPIVDAFGYFGNDPLDNVTLEPVPQGVPGLTEVEELAAGNDFTCARTTDGEVFCWGAMHRASSTGNTCFVWDGYFNTQGAMTGRNADRCAVFPPSGPAVARFSVRTVSDGSCPENGTCSGDFTCNADTNRCEKDEYPIATAFLNQAAFLPRQISTGEPALTIGAGANHLCMVVDRNDAQQTNVRCFGVNSVGQVGDGTNNNWSSPIDLYLDVDDNIVRGVDVSAGNAYSCVLVDEQNIKCWGSNQYGQIGNSALLRDESYRPFDVKLEYTP